MNRAFELASERTTKYQDRINLDRKILNNFAILNSTVNFSRMAEEKAVLKLSIYRKMKVDIKRSD